MRIGYGLGPQQVGDGRSLEDGGVWLTDCNLTARGDRSFADDLVVRRGRVSSRVALLLRAIERHPFRRRILFSSRYLMAIEWCDSGWSGFNRKMRIRVISWECDGTNGVHSRVQSEIPGLGAGVLI